MMENISMYNQLQVFKFAMTILMYIYDIEMVIVWKWLNKKIVLINLNG